MTASTTLYSLSNDKKHDSAPAQTIAFRLVSVRVDRVNAMGEQPVRPDRTIFSHGVEANS